MPVDTDGREIGYVHVWRRIRENEHFWPHGRPFTDCEAWLDMVMEAHWSTTPREVRAGRTFTTIRRGEFAHAIRWFAHRWQWGNGRVSRFFKSCADCHAIELKTERWVTHVTLLNYDTYNPRRNDGGTKLERSRNDGGTLAERYVLEEGKEGKEGNNPPTPKTGGGGGGLSIMDQLENDVDEAAKKAKCPDAMLNKLAEKANQVYGTDYPVAEFLEVFVYPADSILSAADLLEAIRQTGLAGVKRANWTNAVLRAWHEGGGRPDAVVMQGGKPKIDMKAVFEKFKKDHPEYANDLE